MQSNDLRSESHRVFKRKFDKNLAKPLCRLLMHNIYNLIQTIEALEDPNEEDLAGLQCTLSPNEDTMVSNNNNQ